MTPFLRPRWPILVGACLLLCGCKPTVAPTPPAVSPPAADDKPLDKDVVNTIGMKLKLIPAGKFVMGSPKAENDRSDDEAQHEVEITKAFYLGVYPVTKGQFAAFVKDSDYQTQNEETPRLGLPLARGSTLCRLRPDGRRPRWCTCRGTKRQSSVIG